INPLGRLPALYGANRFPGSQKQKLPAAPFLFGAFALGYFAVGPYLSLRQFAPTSDPESLGFLPRIFNSKLTAAGICLGVLGLVAFVASSDPLSDFEGFKALFSSQKLVHVSTCDACILSLAVWEPMREDMMRRGWWPQPDEQEPTTQEKARLAAFCFPLVGPAAYTLARPQLLDADE
ncbi:unnamed protein product, partial [Chrysoparadoxa australica]